MTKKIIALAVVASCEFADAADMASQPWVIRQLAELRTELIAEMQKITPSGGVSRAWVISNVTEAITRTDSATRRWASTRIKSSSTRTLNRANAYSRAAVTNLVTRDFVSTAFDGELATTNWVVNATKEIAQAKSDPFSEMTAEGLINRSNMERQALVATMTNEAYRILSPTGVFTNLADKVMFCSSDGTWEYLPLGASMTVEEIDGGTNVVFSFAIGSDEIVATNDNSKSANFMNGTNVLMSVFWTRTASNREIDEAKGANQ